MGAQLWIGWGRNSETVGIRFEIETAPAAKDWNFAPALYLADRRPGQHYKSSGVKRFTHADDVYKMMADAPLLFGGRFGRANNHSAIDLH